VFIVPAEAILTAIANGRDYTHVCQYWTGIPGSCRKRQLCRDCHPELLPAELREGRVPKSILEGIDALAQHFVPNEEVSDIRLVPLRSLMALVEPGVDSYVAPTTPAWAWHWRNAGRHFFYDRVDAAILEASFRDGKTQVPVQFGEIVANLTTMTHEGCAEEDSVEMERWDQISIRRLLTGPKGSLVDCEPALTSWLERGW